jgi:hypothetical protein
LNLAVTLPVHVRGILIPSDGNTPPSLSWYFDPLPIGSENIIDIKLGETPFPFPSDEFRAAAEKLRAMRPQAAKWISATLHNQLLTELFDESPIRNLTYKWLKEDLDEVFWLE